MAAVITVDGRRSARPGDRIKAVDALARYGLGERSEKVHTIVDPDIGDRVTRTVELIRSKEMHARELLLDDFMAIWRD